MCILESCCLDMKTFMFQRKLNVESVLVSFWKAAKLAVQQRSEKSLQLLSFHIWISVILDSESLKFAVL